MSTLTALGMLGMAFTVVFTWVAYHRAPSAGQSPRSSIVEAWINILTGFSVNYISNFLVLPLVGATLTWSSNWWMGWLFTAISIVRQYVIRRWFNARIHALAERVAA
jgi:hypothetical protein